MRGSTSSRSSARRVRATHTASTTPMENTSTWPRLMDSSPYSKRCVTMALAVSYTGRKIRKRVIV